LTLLLSLGVPAFTPRIQAAEAASNARIDEGFSPIFNDKNWDGWHLKIKSGDAELAKRVFAIEDGVVHVFKDFPDGYELNTGSNSTHGCFYTDKKYSEYVFKFDYKWGKKIQQFRSMAIRCRVLLPCD
jgi:hypothetical protein